MLSAAMAAKRHSDGYGLCSSVDLLAYLAEIVREYDTLEVVFLNFMGSLETSVIDAIFGGCFSENCEKYPHIISEHHGESQRPI
jgi:hypothetical protein